MSYPEHAKLATVQEEHAAVRDFLEAITSAGYQVCRHEGATWIDQHVEPRWMPQDWRGILSAHFAIDEGELERERRAMLANLTGGAL